jgi:uncharacterized protein (DUF305 family)
MRPRAIRIAAIAVTVLALGGCVAANPSAPTHEQLGHPASCSADASDPACALKPDQAISTRTEAADGELNFLMEMVPHHAQAVEMARLCMRWADDVDVVALCTRIIEGQSLQVRDMESSALTWYGQQPSRVLSALDAREADQESTGILTDEDMTRLNGLRGRAFEEAFADEMIDHHNGAIASALLISEAAPHSEVREWARDIVQSQQRDVDTMKQWQQAWVDA